VKIDPEQVAATVGRNGAARPAEAEPLRVPDIGLVGIARDFAETYAAHLESPRSFFYFGCLTYLGALIAGKVTLDSELRPEPRLYTVLLGESADTRKSTALRKVDEFFRALGAGYTPPVLFGVGSAERRAPTAFRRAQELRGQGAQRALHRAPDGGHALRARRV
jgi:acetyl esterase/lipase